MLAFAPLASTPYGDWLEALADGEAEADPPAVEVGADVDISGFYAKMQATASKILAKKKTGTVILHRPGVRTETGDPLDPYTYTPSDVSRNCAVFGFADTLIDGARILAGDRRVVMDAEGLAARPSQEDKLEIDNVMHTIVNVKPIPAAGVAAIYIVQART